MGKLVSINNDPQIKYPWLWQHGQVGIRSNPQCESQNSNEDKSALFFLNNHQLPKFMPFSILMEFISFLCFFIIFLFMLVILLRRQKGKNSTLRLPPGPRQLPIIGNMLHLLGGLPHHMLRDLAEKYGPLMHLRLGEISTVIVTSPEIAGEIFKTHDVIFAQRPVFLPTTLLTYNFSDIVFAPYGDYWRQIRKICMLELLSARRVQTFRSIREEETSDLIDSIRLCEGSPIDLSQRLSSLTYSIIARAAFGKRNKFEEEFIQILEEVMLIMSGFSIADMYPSIKLFQMISGLRSKLLKLHKEIDAILVHIISEHRGESQKAKITEGEQKEDLVDVLLKFQKEGELDTPLTDDNIKAVIFDMFSAGGETSSTIMEWVMSEMMRNPEVMERAQAEVREVFDRRGVVDESGVHELSYLQSVIKETLRLYPPAPLLVPRESSEKCEIDGYEIPAKTRLIVNAWAMARDPRYWTEPERFNPQRFLDSAISYKGKDFEYIPFGAGRRMCPGISFGLANVELPLAKLLYHFNWKLPGGLNPEQLDMTETFALSARKKHHLQLIPILYHPC